MEHQCAFHLGSAHPMTRHVEHVIHTTRNTQIAVLISQRTVTGEVVTGIGCKVGIDHALMIAVDGANLGRPGSFDYQVSGTSPLDFGTLLIQESGLYPEEREAGKAWFKGMRAR